MQMSNANPAVSEVKNVAQIKPVSTTNVLIHVQPHVLIMQNVKLSTETRSALVLQATLGTLRHHATLVSGSSYQAKKMREKNNQAFYQAVGRVQKISFLLVKEPQESSS